MKHAAYTGTRNIYGDMEMCAKSLVSNSDVDKVWFLIEDSEFPHGLPDIVECVDVSGQGFFPDGGPNMKSRFSYMAMIRSALCYVLPDVDTVLSLDCDTFCLRDVSGIWDLDMGDSYFCATPEWHRSTNGLVYCNHGVVLYNLAEMRNGKADECIRALNDHEYTWVDQDVCNYLCQGRISEMPTWFNSNYWTDRGNDPKPRIKHFAGVKREEWANDPVAVFYRDMTWEEALERHG